MSSANGVEVSSVNVSGVHAGGVIHKPGPPLWLLAELTYRCPLHCVFCYNPV
ncbi:MAG: pyrroloquinoline quinone biosynthesis protein PqqE, partial [Rhizobacter sp.]|nr:pyrroloquinoline quinone biosynthesis protein PqqE [Rhizobacter sp.]